MLDSKPGMQGAALSEYASMEQLVNTVLQHQQAMAAKFDRELSGIKNLLCQVLTQQQVATCGVARPIPQTLDVWAKQQPVSAMHHSSPGPRTPVAQPLAEAIEHSEAEAVETKPLSRTAGKPAGGETASTSADFPPSTQAVADAGAQQCLTIQRPASRNQVMPLPQAASTLVPASYQQSSQTPSIIAATGSSSCNARDLTEHNSSRAVLQPAPSVAVIPELSTEPSVPAAPDPGTLPAADPLHSTASHPHVPQIADPGHNCSLFTFEHLTSLARKQQATSLACSPDPCNALRAPEDQPSQQQTSGFRVPRDHGAHFNKEPVTKTRPRLSLNSIATGAKVLLWDVWDPHDPWRVRWDCILLGCMVYVLFVTPYIIAFDISTSDLNSGIGGVDLTVYCIFMLDVLLNFRTAYIDEEGGTVRDRGRIALNYVTGWFWVDVASCLPFSLMVSDDGEWARLIRLTRFLRLLKTLAMVRKLLNSHVKTLLQELEIHLGKVQVSAICLAVSAITVLHWSACMFYYAAAWRNFDSSTWVALWNLVPTETNGLDNGANYIKRYIFALYWATQTMTTVGYGDIMAVSIQEKVVAICVMILGTSMFAFFMGTVVALVLSLVGTEDKIKQKQLAVDEFLHHREVPKALADKVRSYYNYTVPRRIDDEDSDIISGLSLSLRMQVTMHLHRETLQRLPLLRGRDPQFISALVTRFKLEYYSPGDVVVRQGETGKDMYIIGQGNLEARVYSEDTQYISAMVGGPSSTTECKSRSEPSLTQQKRSLWERVGLFQQTSQRQMQGHGGHGSERPGVSDGLNPGDDGSSRQVVMSALDMAHLYYMSAGTLGVGDCFGAYGCLLGQPHAATMVASSYCELYSLSRSSLEEMVGEWPEMGSIFQSLGRC